MKRFFLMVVVLGFPLLAQGWNPPPVAKKELPNGLKIFLLEDHRLPLFQVTVFIRGGGVHEPIAQAGLADLTANLWVTGGTVNKTPKEVDEWLDQNAIRLSASADREWITVTVSALSDQWEESLDFLGEVLMQPRWDPERFLIMKKRALESARRKKDQPEILLDEAFQHAVYGERHPWGKTATLKSLKRIRGADLKNFHQKNFHPGRMIFAAAGDFSKKNIGRWIETWGKNLGAAAPQFSPPEGDESSWEILPLEMTPQKIEVRKKLTQDFIEVGGRSLVRHAPEQYAYGLLQYILGGEPFTSRLGLDIRVKQGLAYTVYSTWETAPVRGLYKIHVETRADAKEKVLASIRDHLQKLGEEGNISPSELAAAKEALLNKYIFWFTSPFSYVVTKARLEMLGYPDDYLEKYPRRMRAVTLKELQAVAKKFIRPETVKTVIVGP